MLFGIKKNTIEAFEKTDPDEIRTALNNKPGVDEIIKLVCQYANSKERRVKTKPKGRRKPDPVRVYAMYACRRYGDASQKQLAQAFGLQYPGSASFSINKIKKAVLDGEWKKATSWLENQLDIVKPAWPHMT